MIRCLDIVCSVCGLVMLSPLLAFLMVLGYFDTGSPLFRQVRVGRRQQPFNLLKFRTMKTNTESVASHLVDASAITAYGRFLRDKKLDELPQLWNVLKGEMSLVGPRPGLANQEELTHERALRRVYEVRPGVTGLAQINGIDMSNPRLLAETDQRMITALTVAVYVRYVVLTIFGRGQGDRVRRQE